MDFAKRQRHGSNVHQARWSRAHLDVAVNDTLLVQVHQSVQHLQPATGPALAN